MTNTGLSSGGYSYVSPFTATFVYKNTLSQTVLIDKVGWTSSQASVLDSGFTPQAVPGAGSTLLGFSVSVFFVDANGAPMGPSASQTFTVAILLTIFYSSVGTVTVSPAGASSRQCTSSCPGGYPYYAAYWPVGTQLTVTTSAGIGPVTWANSPSSNCPAATSGSGYVCTFTVSQTAQPFITGSSSLAQNVIVVFGQGSNLGTISPASICLSSTSYTTSTFGTCSPSATFTITVPQGSTYTGNLWQVLTLPGTGTGQPLSPPVTGTSTTVSLTYAQLSPEVTFNAGQAALQVQVTQLSFLPTLTINQEALGNGQYAQSSPAPGTYTCSSTSTVCQPGSTVQLSVTIPTGYSFDGWIVNGQNVGTANPYTLTIPQTGPTAVQPVVLACTGSCTPPPPPPPPGGNTNVAGLLTNGQFVGGVLFLAIGVYLVTRKK